MTKGKKIATAIAVVLGLSVLVAGVFTTPKVSKPSVDAGTFAKNQIEKLNQMQDLTNELYSDEDTTDMAQLKSQISQIGGSQDSLYQGMIQDLEAAKSQIGQERYNSILQSLQNDVEPAYKKVIDDANAIVKTGYDENPGQTSINYQNALKAMANAENIVAGPQQNKDSNNTTANSDES